MPKYKYFVIDVDPKLENPFEVEIDWHKVNDEYELQDVAERCAKHFYHQCEAYKDEEWPYHFVIEGADGKRLGKVAVGMEYNPVFCGNVLVMSTEAR